MSREVDPGLAAADLAESASAAAAVDGAAVELHGGGVFRPAARGSLFALSFGHACIDLNSGAISALIPFLVVERRYTYGAVGVFVLAASVAGGLLQPVFGHYGDRTGARWLMPFGLVLAGVGIGVVGLVGSYAAVLLAVAVASIGVAAYHPEGARWARVAAGTRVVSGMSVFSVGGGIGFGLSPLLVTAVVAPLGLGGTPLLAVLPLLAALAVAAVVRRLHLRELQRAVSRPATFARRPDEWWPFARLAFMYGVLSAIVLGVMTYVPLFLIDERGSGPGAANAMTTVFLVAAAVGTLLGGRIADRFGRRVVLVFPPLLLIPAIAFLPSLGYAAMVPFIAAIGLVVNAGLSTAIVLAQEYLPERLGLASGITVGASVGVGGVGAALLGLLGDAAGPAAVLYVIAALPLAVVALGASLPRPSALSPESRWGLRATAD